MGSHEEANGRNGARHFVVELKNPASAVELRIHTVLDGTPILERWLEITNIGEKPAAISEVYPWTSHLWRTPHYDNATTSWSGDIFKLGSFTRITHGWEGWLQWQPLNESFTHLESHVGHGFKTPFFVVRNELAGASFDIWRGLVTGTWTLPPSRSRWARRRLAQEAMAMGDTAAPCRCPW